METMSATETKKARAQRISGQIAKMSDDERRALASQMPTVCNPAGHFLTLHNTLLLINQCERDDITMVAGFRQWLKARRCVRKGETSLGYIAVPMRVGKDRENPDDKGKVRFRFVCVFDVSQTDEIESK